MKNEQCSGSEVKIMKKIALVFIALISITVLFSSTSREIDPVLWEKARLIHDQATVVDTHCDTPMVMIEQDIDIGQKQDKTDVDLIRMKEGGVDASFFAVYISNELDGLHPSKKALEMIDEIYRQVEAHPELAEMAFSAGDIINIEKKGKRAILIGMENGGPVEGSLRLLRDFYRLGVRYITLTHMKNNDICDSSTAEKPKWNGLSPFGKKVVEEMNRLGMLIDVSHISDQAFWDVLKISRVPVMASHSCVRAICDSPRNLSDEMIRGLADNGGVIQINFFSSFLDPVFKKAADEVFKKIAPQRAELKKKYKDDQNRYWNELFQLWIKYAPPQPDIDMLIDHIDHVVKLVGVNHVGLGSDYDGASSYPRGLDNISGFPLITYHLLKRGYSREDICKILGGNFLRVFTQVQNYAKENGRPAES
jgi:membrane dipeptidase